MGGHTYYLTYGFPTEPKIERTYDGIILSAGLVGSTYLFATSLRALNKKASCGYNMLNGTICLVSGGMVVLTTLKAISILNK